MKIEIIDIKVIVTEPLNILPTGEMDETKDQWRFGGTSYDVTYTVPYTKKPLTLSLQVEGNVWYDPCYQYTNNRIMKVLQYIADIEHQMYIEYNGEK